MTPPTVKPQPEPAPVPAPVPVPFDAYIHGTTSQAIALALSNTDGELMSPLEMMRRHRAAPMTGEIYQGGYTTLSFKGEDGTEYVGAMSFGKTVTNDPQQAYDLEKIIQKYTRFKPLSKQKALEDFKESMRHGLLTGFSNLNGLLMSFARARQTHSSLDQVITSKELSKLNGLLQATVQFYYFIQLLGTHIHPDFGAITEALEIARADKNPLVERDIYDAVFSLLTMEEIIQDINNYSIDMKAIRSDPTEENLKKALQVLELPMSTTIKSGPLGENKFIQLPITQFFSLKDPGALPPDPVQIYEQDHFGYFSKNTPDYAVNVRLEHFLKKVVAPDYFKELSQHAPEYIKTLEDRIAIFNQLVETDQKQFTAKQQALLKSPYPVILVSQSDAIKPVVNEYRSTGPLKLGDDIRMVATDTPAHAKCLQKIMRQHQVAPVQVVLFHDLQMASFDKSTLPLSIDSDALRNMLTVTKNTKQANDFYRLYELLDDLNDKRNKYRDNNQKAFNSLNELLNGIDAEMQRAFSSPSVLRQDAVRDFCANSNQLINQHKIVLEQHRGILGILDTILTVLVSLIVFYPLVYKYQKNYKIPYTFFSTESGKKARHAVEQFNKISGCVEDDLKNQHGVSGICSA